MNAACIFCLLFLGFIRLCIQLYSVPTCTFILMFVYHMMACLQPVCNNLLRVLCIYLSFVVKLFTRLVERMNVRMFDYEINMCFSVSIFVYT